MADFYTRLKNTAERMIEQYGRQISLVEKVKTGTSYNPIISERLYPIYVVQSEYKSSDIDGSLIQANDKRFLVYSETVIPKTDMQILDNEKKYSIVNVKETKPGNTNIFYEIQARL